MKITFGPCTTVDYSQLPHVTVSTPLYIVLHQYMRQDPDDDGTEVFMCHFIQRTCFEQFDEMFRICNRIGMCTFSALLDYYGFNPTGALAVSTNPKYAFLARCWWIRNNVHMETTS